MNYMIPYACISHIGRCRRMNQDNFICNGEYMDTEANPAIIFRVMEDGDKDSDETEPYIVTGCLYSDQAAMLGVFDGLGGEERGEVASLLAAQEAARTPVKGDLKEALSSFCLRANAKVCHYADKHDIQIMGTTAALLALNASGMALCNIGDSKIFVCSEEGLKQLSEDHLAAVPYGRKPALTQCLGIPPSEMQIEPYTAARDYREGELYMLCSDGLTDMVPQEKILKLLEYAACGAKENTSENDEQILEETARQLLNLALENGGHDNVTILLCRIASERGDYQKQGRNGRNVKQRVKNRSKGYIL